LASLVETDIISDCLNPMWMPWTQRAFIFNRMYSLSSIYIGLCNHTLGPMHHKGCGRIAIDLRAFEPNTVYTLKYELFSSPILTTRKVSTLRSNFQPLYGTLALYILSNDYIPVISIEKRNYYHTPADDQ
jgi:hypothetical protein